MKNALDGPVIAALKHKEIGAKPERISKLKKYDTYDWRGIEFPMAVNKIDKFEKNNPE